MQEVGAEHSPPSTCTWSFQSPPQTPIHISFGMLASHCHSLYHVQYVAYSPSPTSTRTEASAKASFSLGSKM